MKWGRKSGADPDGLAGGKEEWIIPSVSDKPPKPYGLLYWGETIEPAFFRDRFVRRRILKKAGGGKRECLILGFKIVRRGRLLAPGDALSGGVRQ